MTGWRFWVTFGLVGMLMLQGYGCAPRQEHGAMTAMRIVDAKGAALGEAELVARLYWADYVLIGETHNVLADHQVQAGVIDLAARHGKRVAVGLEMLPHSRYDEALAAFSRGETALDYLPQALAWDNTWGFGFDLYADIFRVAQEHGIPIFGLNIDREALNAVRRMGLDKVGAEERERLPSTVILPPQEQTEILRAVFDAHSQRIQEKQGVAPDFERFLLVQSLWDSSMAERAVLARRATGLPVIILAGRGHVEMGYGISHRLAHFDPDARVISILPLRGMPALPMADIYVLESLLE